MVSMFDDDMAALSRCAPLGWSSVGRKAKKPKHCRMEFHKVDHTPGWDGVGPNMRIDREAMLKVEQDPTNPRRSDFK